MERPRDPFQILPKEINEMIIQKVDDSEDLRNLMDASKHLNDSFLYIRHKLRLLDKVLPILSPNGNRRWESDHLGMNHLNNLRLVDKRWCEAVNTFLEKQPCFRPYNGDDFKLKNEDYYVWSHYSSWRTLGSVTLKGFGKMRKFRRMFKKFEGNPFPSRSIIGYTKPDIEGENRLEFWEEMERNVFKKFGREVWFLEMNWELQGNGQGRLAWKPEQVWKGIVKSLKSLPNLKGLTLHLSASGPRHISGEEEEEAKEFLAEEENQLPKLELESLKISNKHHIPNAHLFAQKLLKKYCLKLRRLHVNIQSWKRGNWRLPKLTELRLYDICKKSGVAEVLNELEASNLVKLELKGNSMYNYKVELGVEEDIFEWIKLFPSLLYLDVSSWDLKVSERGTLEPENDSVNLKYLKIRNRHGINYNFMRCLPYLHRLQVYCDDKPTVWDCSVYPEVKIKVEMETALLYSSNIWEICPKLRTISWIGSYINYNNYQDEFDRETYEKFKKAGEEPGYPKGLIPKIDSNRVTSGLMLLVDTDGSGVSDESDNEN